MLNSYDNIHHVESIKLRPIQCNGEKNWVRHIEIGGGPLSWREITLFADTREVLMLDHEKEAETVANMAEA